MGAKFVYTQIREKNNEKDDDDDVKWLYELL